MDDPQIGLAETFADVARTLQAEDDMDKVFAAIVQAALDVIDPCEHAGIDLVEKSTITPVQESSDIAEGIDNLQNEVDEGPCFSAIREHDTFYSQDLAEETRWPKFSSRAHEEFGVRSMLGFRLYTEKDTTGALNMYSSQPHAFDDDAIAIGSVLAAHAGVAMATAQERKQLMEAIESRDLIGRAKGMLMARSDVSDDEAFAILRSASQRMNIKLGDVAEQIVTANDVRQAPPG